MESNGKWISVATVLCGGAWTAAAVLLYRWLVEKQAGEGAAYTLPFLLPVAAGAALFYLLCALQVRRWMRPRFLPETALPEETPEATDVLSPEEITEGTEDMEKTEDAELLPEWEALRHPAEDVPEQEYGWSEKIAAALAAQRAEVTDTALPLPTEPEDPWNALYGDVHAEDTDAAPHDLYAGLSDAPLEGYTLPSDAEESEDLSEPTEAEAHPPRMGGIVWLLALCVLFAAGFSLAVSCFTAAGETGIRVFRAGRTAEYPAAQVESYAVESAFFGGDLELRFQMRDGRTVTLSPERMSTTETFDAAYENVYAFWNAADRELSALGVPKTVQDAAYLADAYAEREDGTWTYVRELLGLPADLR